MYIQEAANFADQITNIKEFNDVFFHGDSILAVSLVPIFQADGNTYCIASHSKKTGKKILIGGMVERQRCRTKTINPTETRYNTIWDMYFGLYVYTYKFIGICLTKQALLQSRIFFQTEVFRSGTSMIHYIHISREIADLILRKDNLTTFDMKKLEGREDASTVINIINPEVVELARDEPYSNYLIQL